LKITISDDAEEEEVHGKTTFLQIWYVPDSLYCIACRDHSPHEMVTFLA